MGFSSLDLVAGQAEREEREEEERKKKREGEKNKEEPVEVDITPVILEVGSRDAEWELETVVEAAPTRRIVATMRTTKTNRAEPRFAPVESEPTGPFEWDLGLEEGDPLPVVYTRPGTGAIPRRKKKKKSKGYNNPNRQWVLEDYFSGAPSPSRSPTPPGPPIPEEKEETRERREGGDKGCDRRGDSVGDLHPRL